MTPRSQAIIAAILLSMLAADESGASRPERHAGAIAQPSGRVEGVVLDQQSRQPIAQADVGLGGGTGTASTGADGRFILAGVATGVHALRVEAEGYVTLVYPALAVAPDRPVTLVLEMARLARYQETVTIVAGPAPDPFATTSARSVTSEEIRRTAGSLGDVQRFLQTLPGQAPVGDIRNDLVTRGGSPVEGLTLVDGFEVPGLNHLSTPGTTGGLVTLVNNELIQDATFISGGLPARYGNRLSSVMDLRLREGNRSRPELQLDANFAGVAAVGEGPLGPGGSWVASVQRSYLDLFVNAAGTESVPAMSAFTAKAAYDLGPRDRVWAMALGGRDSVLFNADEDARDEPDFVSVDHAAWRVASGVAWQRLFGNAAAGVLSISHAAHGFDVHVRDGLVQDNAETMSDRSTSGEATIKYDLSAQAGRRWSLRGGGALKGLRRQFAILQPHGISTPYSVEPRDALPGVSLTTDVATWIASGYVEASGAVAPRTTATVGVRMDTFRALGETTVSPRVGVAFRASRTVGFGLSAGAYTQQPDLAAILSRPENRRLRPMRAEDVVGDARWQPDASLLVSAAAFAKRYRDYPSGAHHPALMLANHGADFESGDTLLLPLVSAGRGRARGLEVFARRRLTGRAYGQAAYTWSSVEHAGTDGIFRRGAFDTTHVLSALGGVQAGSRWHLSGRFTLATGRPWTPALLPHSVDQNRLVYDLSAFNAHRLPSFQRLDIRVERRFEYGRAQVLVFADVQNVLDHRAAIERIWNQRERRSDVSRQLGVLPILGVNVKFRRPPSRATRAEPARIERVEPPCTGPAPRLRHTGLRP